MFSYDLYPRLITIGIFSALGLAAPATAQITPDATLGAESSRLTPNVLIQGGNADRIDGGAQRGGNLFHSFSQFNVAAGQRLYFNNPTGVQNILTRVTGGRSDILGTLGVNGAANLFLLNPNGIVFGPNAQLDVGGSFIGSTASGVQFGNQGSFTVNQTDAPPLLTIQPSALLFTQQSTGNILSNSVAAAGTSPSGRNLLGLQVPTGQTLILAAGDVRIDGGGINGGLNAQGGRIELGGLVGAGSIGLDSSSGQPKLVFPSEGTRGNVAVVNNARISVRGSGGGDVVVNANVLTGTDGGRIVAGTEGAGNAGDISVNANMMNFSGTSLDGIGAISGLSNHVFTTATGRGGAIKVNTNQLTLTSGGGIDTVVYGKGNSGDISINAQTITLQGQSKSDNGINYSGLQSSVASEAIGNAGSISVQTGTLNILDGAGIDTFTGGRGNAGNISIVAKDSVLLSNGTSSISSSVYSKGVGQGGNIQIQTPSLTLVNNSYISSDVSGQGTGGSILIDVGNLSIERQGDFLLSERRSGAITTDLTGTGRAGVIDIKARDRIFIDSGRIGSDVSDGGSKYPSLRGKGDGGSVQVASKDIYLTNAYISADSDGEGNAGSVSVIAANSLRLENRSAISSDVRSFYGSKAIGNGGKVLLKAPSIFITGSSISTGTDSLGNAGAINIMADKQIVVDGGSRKLASIVTVIFTNGIGRGGDVTIVTPSLSLLNNAIILAGTGGIGDSGNVKITADEMLLDKGKIYTSTSGLGNAGNIALDVEQVALRNGSSLNSDVSDGKNIPNSRGNGGNISIKSNSLTLSGGSNLNTSTEGVGRAGNIQIQSIDSISLQNSRINSFVNSIGKGDGGNVQITTSTLKLTDTAEINASTYGQGGAGDVQIQAAESISLQNSGIYSFVGSTAKGDGGGIKVTTGTLKLTDAAQINASTYGQGGAGDIQIQATDSIGLQSSGIYSSVENTGKGRGGNIQLTTGTLKLTDIAQINASTFGQGEAGDIQIQATDSIILAGGMDTGNVQRRSGIYSIVGKTGEGRGGNIQLTTGTLKIIDDAAISSSTVGQGRAGDIRVNAGQSILISGTDRFTESSGLYTISRSDSRGGDIFVTTPRLTLNNRATLRTESNTSNGGNINVNSDVLLLRRNSNISATAGLTQSNGNGGNINLSAKVIVAVAKENSDITANAFSGSGGAVNIQTQGLFGIAARPKLTPLSDITASSDQGIQGTIAITQPDVQPEQGLTELPGDILDASNQIGQSCPNARNGRTAGSFVVSGRGSLPTSPLDPLADDPNLPALAQLSQADRTLTQTPTIPAPQVTASIVEAQGWQKTTDGKVILIAQPVQLMPNFASVATCPVAQ